MRSYLNLNKKSVTKTLGACALALMATVATVAQADDGFERDVLGQYCNSELNKNSKVAEVTAVGSTLKIKFGATGGCTADLAEPSSTAGTLEKGAEFYGECTENPKDPNRSVLWRARIQKNSTSVYTLYFQSLGREDVDAISSGWQYATKPEKGARCP